MELSILLAEQIMALFLMGLVGYVAVKSGKFSAKDSKIISNVVVYICSPFVVIDAFQIDFTAEKLRGLLLAFAASALVHALMIGGGKLLGKPLGLNGIEKASVEYTNSGYLIIPLVSAVLGQEWVFYTTAFIIVQTVLVWTHGQAVICGRGSVDVKKIFMNPNVIAIGIGLVLFALKIHFPVPIASCISAFGDAIGPISMLVVGMLVGDVDLLWVFRQKRPYLICALRLILFPVIAVFLFAITGMTGMHAEAEYILLIVLLATSAPSAVMVTQLAQIYDRDAKYASVINIMSVIFSIVTMPLIVLLYESLI